MNTHSKSLDPVKKKNTKNEEGTKQAIEMQDIDSSPFQEDFVDNERFALDDFDNRQGSKNNSIHASSTERGTFSTTTSSLMTDLDADKLSYKEFLKALSRTRGAPELLLLCIFMSFGYGTFAIVGYLSILFIFPLLRTFLSHLFWPMIFFRFYQGTCYNF